MREIKFRALTQANNVMVFGDLVNTPENTCRIIWFENKGELPLDADYDSFNELVQKSTIGQFTGLKDKNEVDIYDGDILSIGDKKMIVEWSKRFSSFSLKRDDWAFTHWFGESCEPDDCEVIGNIYENPELLTK